MNDLATPVLFEQADWNFELLRRIYDAVEKVATRKLGLDTYPNQIEVITAEQMLDAFSSTGMPLFYKHWSFGKQFLANEMLYRKGMKGLAYELVINSNPCLCYIMEENTATMQALVIAHAAFGHNHFFKNNYLFKQWTDAGGIVSYLEFAKNYIASCEEKYGQVAVERLLDAAHALMHQGVHRYPRAQARDLEMEAKREAERHAHRERMYDDLWRTLPRGKKKSPTQQEERRHALHLPQENLLYFLEKSAPRLEPWQREILRITRLIAQYFFPQMQTKVMNEGAATFCHYEIMTELHETGQLSDGAFMEFLSSHTNVIFQPAFDSGHYSGMNPYALGFGIMQDVARLCVDPTEEDRQWFPDIAGKGDPFGVLRHIWANYCDESFVSQFLSPRLIRQWRLFKLDDHEKDPALVVDAIHDDRGYRKIRKALSRHYDIGWQEPNIQIVDVDMAGDRRLILEHHVTGADILLAEKDAAQVLQHLANLWGYEVFLAEVDHDSGRTIKEHRAQPRPYANA